jgi:Mrp family chromosome partitioning ATPase
MSASNWKRSISHIALANKGFRLIGFTGVSRGAGVSTISRRVACSMADSGEKVLVVSVSEIQGRTVRAAGGDAAAAGALRAEIVPSVHGYDLLSGPTSDTLLAALGAVQFRENLDGDLAEYSRVVLDLPPICDESGDSVGSTSFAAICDRVLLVCLLGVDRKAEIAEASAILNGAGAPLSGVVSNEFKHENIIRTFLRSRLVRAMQ